MPPPPVLRALDLVATVLALLAGATVVILALIIIPALPTVVVAWREWWAARARSAG